MSSAGVRVTLRLMVTATVVLSMCLWIIYLLGSVPNYLHCRLSIYMDNRTRCIVWVSRGVKQLCCESAVASQCLRTSSDLLLRRIVSHVLLDLTFCSSLSVTWRSLARRRQWSRINLVDPASSHMLVSKIKPCMSQYKLLYGETANGLLKQL